MLGAQSLPWQWRIHDRAYRSITTSCRNHSPGANAPRASRVALRRRSMQILSIEFRECTCFLPAVGYKPFSDAPVFGRCHVGRGMASCQDPDERRRVLCPQKKKTSRSR